MARRSSIQREHDLMKLAERYLRGDYQSTIARDLGVSQQTISKDIKELQKRWLASSLVDFNEAKAIELARIDNLERTYWEAWNRSVEARTIETTRVLGGLEKQSIRTVEKTTRKEELIGDVRFLDGIQKCITQRCKIIGLYSEDKALYDWRTEVIELLVSGKVTRDDVISELGNDLASELFITAGIPISED